MAIASSQWGNGALHTSPRHSLLRGLVWSWHPPLSMTEQKQYHAAGVLACVQHCSKTALVASHRRKPIMGKCIVIIHRTRSMLLIAMLPEEDRATAVEKEHGQKIWWSSNAWFLRYLKQRPLKELLQFTIHIFNACKSVFTSKQWKMTEQYNYKLEICAVLSTCRPVPGLPQTMHTVCSW